MILKENIVRRTPCDFDGKWRKAYPLVIFKERVQGTPYDFVEKPCDFEEKDARLTPCDFEQKDARLTPCDF